MSRDHTEKFRAAYIETLTAAVTKCPTFYGYGVDKVPATVDKMLPSLATGGANIGPAVKAAARKLGIKPTMTAIKAYLTPTAEKPLTLCRCKSPVIATRANGTSYCCDCLSELDSPAAGTREIVMPDENGTHYKIANITDATGARWWVNAWTDGTPYHAMGASSTRPAPIEATELKTARAEALAALKGGAL